MVDNVYVFAESFVCEVDKVFLLFNRGRKMEFIKSRKEIENRIKRQTNTSKKYSHHLRSIESRRSIRINVETM